MCVRYRGRRPLSPIQVTGVEEEKKGGGNDPVLVVVVDVNAQEARNRDSRHEVSVCVLRWAPRRMRRRARSVMSKYCP